MSDAYPRLLVATEFSPNAPGGGPAVVRQMLRDWPAEQLTWWSCHPDRDQKFGRRVADHRIAQIPEKLYPHRRWGPQKSWVLENIWTGWAARQLRHDLNTLRPEAIWVIPHSWSIPPLAKVLSETKFGFHVSIHDYADCGSAVRSFGAGACARQLAMADRLYAKATTCDAICQPMLEDLRQRTGREGTIARAGLESEDFEFLSAQPLPTEGPLRIAYAGTILVEETFALFVSALKLVRDRLPRPAVLEFFGNHSYRARPWFEPAWMSEHGNLSAAELAAALRKCDWGFSPMAITDDDPRYNRFSLPTKFVSYLGAGLPVITLGHPESSVVKLAQTYDVGVCLTTSDAQSIGDQLAAALAEPHPKPKYGATLEHCARAEFDTSRMRSVLYDNFRKCAAVTRRGGSR